MTTESPLIITDEVRDAIRQASIIAQIHPFNLAEMRRTFADLGYEQKLREQLNRQSVIIPLTYLAIFTIEEGLAFGTCRHLSLSSAIPGSVPTSKALWVVAEEFGFHDGLLACNAQWTQELPDSRFALHVMQAIKPQPARDPDEPKLIFSELEDDGGRPEL